jgi:uncharacterized protein YeaO (DUF488 family)
MLISEEPTGQGVGVMAAADTPSIRAVRAYELGVGRCGRWLVDRQWPRGVKRDSLQLAGWAREAAPSNELRRSFGHDPSRWEEFRRIVTMTLVQTAWWGVVFRLKRWSATTHYRLTGRRRKGLRSSHTG